MANNNVSFHQHAVIEFLVNEEIATADIHHRLQRVYGDVCMGVNSVRRWVKRFKDGNTSIQDQPHSGRPQTASTEPNKKRVDEIIKTDVQRWKQLQQNLEYGTMQFRRLLEV